MKYVIVRTPEGYDEPIAFPIVSGYMIDHDMLKAFVEWGNKQYGWGLEIISAGTADYPEDTKVHCHGESPMLGFENRGEEDERVFEIAHCTGRAT